MKEYHTVFGKEWLALAWDEAGKAQRGKIIKDPDKPAKESTPGDFPGGPVVKTSPSCAGGAGSIPGQGAKIPRASQPKKKSLHLVL